MLAYSSIAHAGFILVGVLALDAGRAVSATLFYLLAYGVHHGRRLRRRHARARLGRARRRTCPSGPGLGRRSPLVAARLRVVPAGLRGHPADQRLRRQVRRVHGRGEGGAAPLVVVGVLASAVAAFFYVRVIVLMFFSEPAADGPTVAVPSVLTTAAVTAWACSSPIVLGVCPQPLLDLADQASVFLR